MIDCCTKALWFSLIHCTVSWLRGNILAEVSLIQEKFISTMMIDSEFYVTFFPGDKRMPWQGYINLCPRGGDQTNWQNHTVCKWEAVSLDLHMCLYLFHLYFFFTVLIFEFFVKLWIIFGNFLHRKSISHHFLVMAHLSQNLTWIV